MERAFFWYVVGLIGVAGNLSGDLFLCSDRTVHVLSDFLSGGGGCCHVRGFGFPELRGKNRTGSSFYSGHHVLAVNFRAFRRVNQRFDQQWGCVLFSDRDRSFPDAFDYGHLVGETQVIKKYGFYPLYRGDRVGDAVGVRDLPAGIAMFLRCLVH